MLNKVRDFMDTEVSMVIITDNADELLVAAKAIVSAGRERFKYEVYKEPGFYAIELRTPYNRYRKLMKELIANGYTLRPESKADVFNRLIKL